MNWALLATRSRPGTRADQRNHPAQLLRSPIVIVASVLGIVVALPFFLGVPGPLHDWSWPLWRPEFKALPQTYASMWLDQGLGSENFRRAISPNILSVALLGFLFGARIGLVLYVALSFFVGVIAAYAMARSLGAPKLQATIAALVYATSPVIVYRIFSGHSFFWLGYETLPLVGYTIASLDPRIAIPITGFILSLDIPTPKLLLIGLTLLVLSACVFRRYVTLWSVPLTLGCAAPTIGAVAYGWAAGGLGSYLHTFPMWELNNSLPALGALRGIGYFTQTFEHAVPWESQLWVAVTVVVVIYFIIGTIFRRSLKPLLVLVPSFLGYVLTTAATGPWQIFFLDLFQGRYFSALRDPFDFAAFTSVGLLAAIATSASRWWNVFLASVLLADQLWATLFGFYSMPRTILPEAATRAFSIIVDTPGNGHVLYLPIVGERDGGSETWPFLLGTHGTLNSYFDEGISLSVTRYLSNRLYLPSAVLAAAGVQWVILRPGSPDSLRRRFPHDRGMRLLISDQGIQLWYNKAYSGRAIANWPCSSPLLFRTLIEIVEERVDRCAIWSLPAREQGHDLHIYNNWIRYRAGFPHDPVAFEAGIAPGIATLGAQAYKLPPYLPAKARIIAAGTFHLTDGAGVVTVHSCGGFCRAVDRSVNDGYLFPHGPVVLWGFEVSPFCCVRAHFRPLILASDRLTISASGLANMNAAGWNDGAGPLFVSHHSYHHVLFGGLIYNVVPMFLCLVSWLIIGVMVSICLLSRRNMLW